MAAARVRASVRFRAYTLFERAVEGGVKLGWARAHKHTDDPGEELIEEKMIQAVMEEFSEIINFDL